MLAKGDRVKISAAGREAFGDHHSRKQDRVGTIAYIRPTEVGVYWDGLKYKQAHCYASEFIDRIGEGRNGMSAKNADELEKMLKRIMRLCWQEMPRIDYSAEGCVCGRIYREAQNALAVIYRAVQFPLDSGGTGQRRTAVGFVSRDGL